MVTPGPTLFHRYAPLLLLLGSIWLATNASAGDVSFRRHVINPESEYSAVAVLDIDRDGKHDIFCGGFWYQAPNWKRHFVRDVERIRGRFDGYSHAPLDVNGDGWMDVITVNYRSRSIRWLEHPGSDLGEWAMYTAAEPGAMETGRLIDVNGDGRLDVLPNGQQFAAWWEVTPGTPTTTAAWTRHELPLEVAGHGLGFGDIDGDGRGDVIGPQGWATAPADRRRERWRWNPEFELGRASVPVLVVDVDDDGDNDLVWTKAHGFGVYWLEQARTAQGARRWIQHTIDASWSQCHSPLWADLDGNGTMELVAGKRYMAHEGRDPGAYDPLVSYRYEFDPATRSWRRWVISAGEQVGYGLDPKVVDLDDDGDLDLVVCGRSGLYWLENEGARTEEPVTASVPTYDQDSELMVVKDATGSARAIATPFDWSLKRSHIVAAIQRELGSLPSSHDRVALDMEIVEQLSVDNHIRQTITYRADANRRVQADLWLPLKYQSGTPGVILLGEVAESTAIDVGNQDTHNLAIELVGRGYVCIVPKVSLLEGPIRRPLSLSQLTLGEIWHCIRAGDVLESLPQVDDDRLACIGTGSGAQIALLTMALDQRCAAALCSGELAAFPAVTSAKLSFAFRELVAAVAPRPLLLHVPNATDAKEMTALRQGVKSASAVAELYRGAEAPLLEVSAPEGSATAASPGLLWLDEHLMRSPSRRQPPNAGNSNR